MEQKVGIIIALVVVAAIGLLLYLNIQPGEPEPRNVPPAIVPDDSAKQPRAADVMGGIETPIGDEVERNGMLIAAAWLPRIEMEGLELPQHELVIHLEADIHALPGNKNGFGVGAWIPSLTVRYEIQPIDPPGETIRGEFDPMVAKDGPHYGATIEMPGPGKYKLTYHIDNPSKKGFGRHSDPITGVDPWWDAFDVEFDFDYQPKRRASSGSND
jgi:hypothetical protein